MTGKCLKVDGKDSCATIGNERQKNWYTHMWLTARKKHSEIQPASLWRDQHDADIYVINQWFILFGCSKQEVLKKTDCIKESKQKQKERKKPKWDKHYFWPLHSVCLCYKNIGLVPVYSSFTPQNNMFFLTQLHFKEFCRLQNENTLVYLQCYGEIKSLTLILGIIEKRVVL